MDDIDKIKQRIGIVDLIQEYIPLKKMGRNFKTNCPFHLEKTPSFVVSPERQIWHCFGCSKGGDIFEFLMEYEKIDFSESLKYLANKAGVKLATPVFRDDREKKKDLIFTLNSLSMHYYNYLLTEHPVGKDALTYITDKRKVPLGLVKKLNLGYAPYKNDALTSFLVKKKGYKEQDLIDAGLANRINGRTFDFFRHRIIFPILDPRENVIAFSGRTLDSKTLPKYINTKETLVYKKGDTLFGINIAKDEIKKEGRSIVVEGELDVISAFKEGIKNIVAVKGTALTEQQIKLLKRYAPKISFCFDSDPAGTAAQRRSIELIEKEGVLASVIIPPSGKDPDEILNENPLLFKKAIKEDVNIFDFIINSALSSSDKKTVEGKRSILDKTLPFLNAIENEVIKEHFFKKLSQELDVSLESLLKQSEKLKEKTYSKPQVFAKKEEQGREELLEEYLLALIFQSKNPAKLFEKVDEIIKDNPFIIPASDKLYKFTKEYFRENEEFVSHSFVKNLPTELTEAFDKCYLFPIHVFDDEKDYLKEMEKVAKEVKTLSVKLRLKKLGEQIKEKEKEPEELKKLEEEFNLLTNLLSTKQVE